MAVNVQCACGKRLRVKDEFVGRHVKCPSCHSALLVIASAPVAPYDAFLSHSNADKNIADAICSSLEAAGIRCWIAPRDVVPGAEWGTSIMGAISQCRVMVLVFSKQSNQSKQVRREVERAVSKGLTIIPVRIEDVAPSEAMEYFISSQHWLDAITPPFAAHLERLTAATKAVLDSEHTQNTGQNERPIKRHPGTLEFDARAASATSQFPFAILAGTFGLSLVLALILYGLSSGKLTGPAQQTSATFGIPAADQTYSGGTAIPAASKSAFAAGFFAAAVMVEKSKGQEVTKENLASCEKAINALAVDSQLPKLILAAAPGDDALSKAVMELPESINSKHGSKAKFSALTGTHLAMLSVILQAEAVLDEAQRTRFRKTANVDTQVRQVVVSAQLADLPKEFVDDLNRVEAAIKHDPSNRDVFRDCDMQVKLAAARIIN